MRFSRQEYWSGLPFPSPGDLLNLGMKPTSALIGGFFTTKPPEACSVSIALPFLEMFNKMNHIIFSLLRLRCFICNMFLSFIHFVACVNSSFLFYYRLIMCLLAILHFISSQFGWIFGLFLSFRLS